MLALLAFTAICQATPYSFDATFVEGCSCLNICPAEITGFDSKCHGVAAMKFNDGTVGTSSIKGAKAAWMWEPGRVVVYIEATDTQRPAVEKFLRAALADWGKFDSVDFALVDVRNDGSNWIVNVDGGKVAELVVKPVLGRGGAAVEHNNLSSIFHSSLYQGETVSGKYRNYRDNGHFELSATNAFFNPHTKMHGSFKL